MSDELCDALWSDDLDAVISYIDQGGDAAVVHGYSRDSMLHVAASAGALEVVRWLVEISEFDVNIVEDNGFTPLYEAVRNDRTDVCVYLLQAGADPECGGGNVYELAKNNNYLKTARAIAMHVRAQWSLVSEDEVMRCHTKYLAGYTMTEIFNMRAGTYLLTASNLETRAESVVMKTFAELEGSTLVDDAEKEFSERGGKGFSRHLDKKKGLMLD
jgi:hypothetical protein